ncbi:MAG: hypothetical protein QNL04_01660 [SAR324 cluster bacterium]|nr:hypothetical protein [SAR324 cluster bacterium]
MKQALLPTLPAWQILLLGIFFLTVPLVAQAGDLKLKAGVSQTLLVLPLSGTSIMGGYATDGLLFWDVSKNQQEVTLTKHSLSGSGETTYLGVTGNTSVTFDAWELGYFVTWKFGEYEIGPGISYGVAETTETENTTGDPSPFFTATDIHYGTGLIRISTSILGLNCDANFGTFGGLLGGSFLCGF